MNLVQSSIVIPVYNAHRTLSRCVQSIVDQVTDNSFKIILIDEGSTDDSSANLCENLANSYPRIISFYRYENSGAFIARSRGILQAKGEYIYFLDAYNYWNQNAIQIISRIIEKYSLDVILFGYDEVRVDKSITSHVPPFNPGYYSSEKIELFITELLGKDILNILWSKVLYFLNMANNLNSMLSSLMEDLFCKICTFYIFLYASYVDLKFFYAYVHNVKNINSSPISEIALESVLFVCIEGGKLVEQRYLSSGEAQDMLVNLTFHGFSILLSYNNQDNSQKQKLLNCLTIPILYSNGFSQFERRMDILVLCFYYRNLLILIRWSTGLFSHPSCTRISISSRVSHGVAS